MSTKVVLVTGATGQQGGAVARHLLKETGFAVRAFTRDANKPNSAALAQAGAELCQGDLDDRDSVRRAIAGAWGVYSVQDFMSAGFAGEVRQGQMLADEARRAGVKHFVYSSVVSADKGTGIPHFESKWQIEQHLAQIGLNCTILRPVFFMQNWNTFLRVPILQGMIPLPLKPQTHLQQIAVEDIGAFACKAFQDPPRWSGRAIELAGEELTLQQVASTLSRVLARNVRYVQVPWEQFRQSAGEEMTKMYRWFEEVGYHVNIAALQREHDFLTLEQVLRRLTWKETEARKTA
jgi:uncharacterized protein YbjT (DUF2867 family)